MQWSDVDLDELLLAEVARLRSLGVAIDASGVSAARVRGDRASLGRLVRNLVDNGARHRADRLALAVGPGTGGVGAVLSVDDDGPGVPPEDRERIFHRFARIDEARARASGGAGLGLALVRAVAEAHGGAVQVTDSLLGGARFVVELPAGPGGANAGTIRTSPTNRHRSGAQASPRSAQRRRDLAARTTMGGVPSSPNHPTPPPAGSSGPYAGPERGRVRHRIGFGLFAWFRTPPRRHGEVRYGREVSFLELFYDLVYVVLIGRITHRLAEQVSGRGTTEFAVVFGLIWLSWFNGTFWHELHGREDGRSRNYIFLQMGLLALLAVFAGQAAGSDGRPFALTYGALFTLFAWQWYQVRRIDTDERYRPTTARYLAGVIVSVIVVLASAFFGDVVRLGLWAVIVAGWLIGGIALVTTDHTEGFGEGVTRSLVERMGLFTIIVLGEVVVGVVGGISETEPRSVATIATGMIGLTIGMGMWWNYFDLLGRRVPGWRGPRLASWMYCHLPLAMAIAASGAGMVSLVHNADAARTPSATSWLLAGSVVVTLGCVTLACTALPPDELPRGMVRLIGPSFAAASALVLIAGALRPPPMVLVAAISIVLLLVWLALFAVFLALGGDPDVTEFELGHDRSSQAPAS